ncbi:MAG: hypothetical protein ACRC33_09210 [Gemmataceae bacterium]
MNDDVRTLVALLHESPAAVALVLTGGGVAAPAWLLGVPGGSRTVVEVAVPYAPEAFDAYLAASPASYCSAEAAALLARRARQRAAWLAPGRRAVGVACTASLRSDRPKRGDHRAHVAAATADGVAIWSLTFVKEARSREDEDAVAARLVLNALADALGVPGLALDLLPDERVERADGPGSALWPEGGAVCVEPDGRVRAGGPTPPLVLAGSFNPLHRGHLGMLAAASRHLGLPGAFEISAVNVEKPGLDEEEMRRRAAQFGWRAPVWFTRAPTFPRKAEAVPGAVFLLGADTAARVVQPHFYDGGMLAELDAVRRAGCRFLVAGRVEASGAFVGLADLPVPDEARDLFDELPGFRLDVSSTMLRG